MSSENHTCRIFYTVFALLLTLPLAISAQNFGEWELLNPEYLPDNLRSVSFADSDNVWAVGDNGLLLHSSDGGFSWNFQGTGLKTGFSEIQFVDSQNAWIVGRNGLILHSNNGGARWTIQNSGTDVDFLTHYFLNENIGWAVGRTSILMTTNGGLNWEESARLRSGITLNGIHFLNEDYGVAVGTRSSIEQILMVTEDGGITWEETSIGSGNEFYDVHILDEGKFIIAARNGRIHSTSDGGDNWRVRSIADNTSSLRSIHFIDENNGWVAGTFSADGNTAVLFTEDGGENWTEINSEFTGNIYSIDVLEDGYFVAVGLSGLISTTTDNGTTVQNLPGLSTGFNSIQFIDSDNGWIAGGGGTLLNTTDGGGTWETVKRTGEGQLRDIFFADNMNGWIASGSGQVRKTTDGGLNWETIQTEVNHNLMSITFTDSNIGWTVGSSGTVLKTEDGGDNWTAVDAGTTSILYSVAFINDTTGFIAGGRFSSGFILKTTDSGETWEEVRTLSGAIFDLHFVDESVGWAAASGGVILKTENGGSDWFGQSNNASGSLNSVFFSDPDNGWAVGRDGETAYTTNGGSTWQALEGINGLMLNDVYIDEANRMWTVGVNGLIMKFNETDSPAPVNLLFPADEVEDVSISSHFIWGSSFGASSYELQVSADQIFTNLVIDEPELLETSFTPEESLGSVETYYWRVRAASFGVISEWSDVYSFTTELATSIAGDSNMPREINLSQNYPNPFNPYTTFQFGLPAENHVELAVYDITGRVVARLADSQFSAGYHTISFDASSLASGVYFYRLNTGNNVMTRSMTLIK